ncbi:UNVERIFIED_CONTAM: hypothetical protein NCL1_60154 [Trichonephila clavipes]
MQCQFLFDCWILIMKMSRNRLFGLWEI